MIAWVDGADPVWAEKFVSSKRKEDGSEMSVDTCVARYRDWGLLKYWFRGVEKFTPWVRKVFFITDNQTPSWLNVEAPKLVCINHSDYLPADCLPVFSSHPIELNMHRIKGLSEHFVYFNDDMFVTGPMGPEKFFRNGLPVDRAALLSTDPDSLVGSILSNNLKCLNDSFDKKEVIRKNPGKWFCPQYLAHPRGMLRTLNHLPDKEFPGFSQHHLPTSFLKSTLEEVWDRFPEILDRTTHTKFRSGTDVNQWLFKCWQLVKGDFVPYDVYRDGRSFILNDRNTASIARRISRGRYKMVCLNDGPDIKDFTADKDLLISAFESILPEKSSFEL